MASNTAKHVRVAPNGQISIGKEWAGREIRIEKVNEGELRIVSGQFVPDHLAAFYTSKAVETLKDFNKWTEKNLPQPSDTDAILGRIEKKVREKAKKPRR